MLLLFISFVNTLALRLATEDFSSQVLNCKGLHKVKKISNN